MPYAPMREVCLIGEYALSQYSTWTKTSPSLSLPPPLTLPRPHACPVALVTFTDVSLLSSSLHGRCFFMVTLTITIMRVLVISCPLMRSRPSSPCRHHLLHHCHCIRSLSYPTDVLALIFRLIASHPLFPVLQPIQILAFLVSADKGPSYSPCGLLPA